VGCGVWGAGCGVRGLGCGVKGVGCGVWDFGVGMWGVGCGVEADLKESVRFPPVLLHPIPLRARVSDLRLRI
jgi:hypothetical protein